MSLRPERRGSCTLELRVLRSYAVPVAMYGIIREVILASMIVDRLLAAVSLSVSSLAAEMHVG